MKRKREAPAMPAGYMGALARLYGKQPIGGPETALESTQAVEVLPMHHSPKKSPQRLK